MSLFLTTLTDEELDPLTDGELDPLLDSGSELEGTVAAVSSVAGAMLYAVPLGGTVTAHATTAASLAGAKVSLAAAVSAHSTFNGMLDTPVPANEPGQVLVVYRSGDTDSHNLALYYQSIYALSHDQLLAVPCSTREVLDTYAEFQTEVEDTVLERVMGAGYDIHYIVVCPNVPGGFRDGEDVISTTSRLSRVNFSFEKNLPNPLFDRRDLTSLDDDAFEQVLVCSRIDAPTLATAMQMVNAGQSVLKQGTANGTFFIDPYPATAGPSAQTYTEELVEFTGRTLPLLHVDTFSTVSANPYEDLVLPFVEQDSFMWACGADRSDDSFFHWTGAIRVFLYNADTDSAATVRNESGTRWPQLAIANGYSNTAGSMSSVTEDHYLRPRPFFHALMAGSTVGEAYLLAVPYLDSPETVFGDPLVTVSFVGGEQPPVKLNVQTGASFMLDELGQASACMYRRELLAQEIRQAIFASGDIETMTLLLYKADDLKKTLENRYTEEVRLVTPYVAALVAPDPRKPTSDSFVSYLVSQGLKLPKLLADVYRSYDFDIPEARVESSGTWHVDFTLEDLQPSVGVTYQFVLELATDEAFENVVVTANSQYDPTRWLYQKEIDEFTDIPSGGVPSSFISRRIRYGGTGLTLGSVYYVRFAQRAQGHQFDWVTQTLVVAS